MKLTGARILMECLREQKVDTIFGYPGGTILNVYDALYDYKEITHNLTSHEQGAAHAADGYARSTGKVGVCFATSGPGATNLTTGIATAYMDSSSVVFISCNVPQNLIGRDAFQEVDITGITMPITKSTYLVRDVTKLADTVREAFALARSGRPGPVVIDITRAVTSAECDYEPLPLEQHAASGHLASLIRRAYTSSLKMPEADLDDVEKLVEMIAESKKPMLICGGGVVRSRAHEEFRQFVRRIDAPVAITVMGGGGVSGRDVMTTGMIGMHGSVASNMACDNCDLLIAVGCRFSDRVALDPESFASQAKIVQIDEYRVDFTPEGYLLLAPHVDQPNMIGQISTILGQARINITGMQVGRMTQAGNNIMAIAVQDDIPNDIMLKLRSIDGILDMKLIHCDVQH